ncbi:hypothetical protein MDA_GLEAN10003847 [Myotis davidii]|uniref:Uncharacterized protein n=1 Tax=Myotis davidii TaxID=225400 RepID=L5M6T4_MYODS|nr:hypothetical protein MDA_GLEAN10003847 [Myotis davidii]
MGFWVLPSLTLGTVFFKAQPFMDFIASMWLAIWMGNQDPLEFKVKQVLKDLLALLVYQGSKEKGAPQALWEHMDKKEIRATLDNQGPEAHLAWMAVMELKELLDFQVLMAILDFSDHLYASRCLYIISNGFAFLKVCPFSPIWITLSIYGATTAAPCLIQKSVLAAPQH